MSTVTLDVDIPAGYEATGEFREPKSCEMFAMGDGGIGMYSDPALWNAGPRVILRKLEPPAGYELTGEYRARVLGEFYKARDYCSAYETFECDARFFAADSARKRWILRKAWTPPKWMPEGWWLYLAPKGWWITPTKPSGPHSAGFYGMACSISFPAEELAALSRETFEPPTHTKCIQIKH